MAVVTLSETVNRELAIPNIEVIQFTTAAAGDTYDSKKFGKVIAAFSAQETADGNEIQLAYSSQSTGSQRITISPGTGITTGWLIIFGRK